MKKNFLLCKIKVAQGRGLEGHISLGLWDYNQNTQSWQVAHILDFMKKNCMQTCQVVIEKHWWFVHHEHSSYQSSSEKLNLDRCACSMHAFCMHTCQNEVVKSCIWLIWPSDSDLFAHFSIFFTCFILPPLSHCARSDLYFFLHQNCFYHEIGKIKSHLCLKKNLHVALLKFQVTETQKWCYFFIAKEEVYSFQESNDLVKTHYDSGHLIFILSFKGYSLTWLRNISCFV